MFTDQIGGKALWPSRRCATEYWCSNRYLTEIIRSHCCSFFYPFARMLVVIDCRSVFVQSRARPRLTHGFIAVAAMNSVRLHVVFIHASLNTSKLLTHRVNTRAILNLTLPVFGLYFSTLTTYVHYALRPLLILANHSRSHYRSFKVHQMVVLI